MNKQISAELVPCKCFYKVPTAGIAKSIDLLCINRYQIGIPMEIPLYCARQAVRLLPQMTVTKRNKES